jgi:microcystin-dependent protein
MPRCRALSYPDSAQFDALLIGALLDLANPDCWEQHGELTPEETAAYFSDMLWSFRPERGCMYVGTVFYAAGALEGPNVLACDGTSYRRNDYPVLFAVIGTVFGAPDGDTFNVPNLEGIGVIGAGHDSGGGGPDLGDTGGASDVTLTTDNLPAHDHSVHGHLTGLAVAPGELVVNVPSINGSTGSTGNGQSFSVTNPYVALLPYIVAR